MDYSEFCEAVALELEKRLVKKQSDIGAEDILRHLASTNSANLNAVQKLTTSLSGFTTFKTVSDIRTMFLQCLSCFRYSEDVSEDAKSRMSNLAAALYLWLWLDNDPNATQNISFFSRYSFLTAEEAEKVRYKRVQKENDPDDFLRKALQRADQIYRTMITARVKQAEYESREEPMPPIVVHGKRDLSFSEIYFIKAYIDQKLLLFELLSTAKYGMRGTNMDKREYDALKQGYELHNQIFADAKALTDPKEYVSACVFAMKYEFANRFTLIGKIAQYLKEHKLPMNQLQSHNKTLADTFWGRYYGVTSSSPSEFSFSAPVEYYDILNYDVGIVSIFTTNDDDAVKALDAAAYLERTIFTLSFNLLLRICNPKDLPSWTEESFSSALEFFKNDYPIIERYRPIILGDDRKRKDSPYKFIYEYYESAATDPNSTISVLRSAYSNQNKQ